MHYGHRLETGVFVTPVARPAQNPVAIAKLAEDLGFDLATYQDHPYQPSFLDAWTLMSYVAAQTEKIRVMGNVHNVPLRQPAVLARSAASLDLLSGGRVDLGLGAGAFWDAMVAMGAERLTPGQGVTALEEAIDIIRGIWDEHERSPLRVAGEFHRVDGAKRGPAPSREIPIVLGALKPRMLRLIGRKADGWVPSQGYLAQMDGGNGLTAFADGNAVIDAAAEAAGRDPREIRRMINLNGRFSPVRTGFLSGPSESWVEDLLPLVVEHGASTLILASDDPAQLQQFAQEVVPALRDAIDAEVEGGWAGVRVRPRKALDLRHEGVDYDGVPLSLVEHAVEPGDRDYVRARGGYMRGGSPGIVLRPGSTSEVVEALAFARRQPHLPLGVRSGGHGISGRSTNAGGIVLDLGKMRKVEVVDEESRLVRVQPGARWMDVAREIGPRGWAISSGDFGGVGVGGLATAGGIGFLGREHGLTIDHVREVEMVLADGSVVVANDEQNTELFWGVRGAGANLGIVTSFLLEAPEVGEVGWGVLTQDAEDTADYLTRWGAYVQDAPRDTTSFLLMGRPRPGQPRVVQTMTMVDASDADTIVERLQPIAAISPLYGQDVRLTTYTQVLSNAPEEGHVSDGEPHGRSGLLERMTPEFAAAAAEMLESGEVFFFQIRATGGAASDVAPEATAYAHRSASFAVSAMGVDGRRLDRVWAPLRTHFVGLYSSFETDESPARVREAFPTATLDRLKALKAEIDPEDVFNANFDVTKA
ncbi:LLM class flavin-dependent oxidoreductase [Sanguibacter sp. HDW7]|uniref:LLM class flavin-dependent oxidoreductase n=1 Tax=Sanguibacter sp. HDW7 TaxID=2714931 RepID=UPI001409F693|nr:LLM class flavin-dependent oxidoreductase [Sanguibacter sp. HDW7]QIK83029.1 LLM class flavin-dependent oxidoreductase [Sanguibacter sp. HDW7]